MKDSKNVVFFIYFLALGILYVLAHHAYYVGFFNDDAFYIIGSRSLLQGRYAELNHPQALPMVHYMPGYPLMLALVSFFSPVHFLPYQILSIVLTLGSIFLIARLYQDESPKPALISIVLLSSLNPLTVSLSGTVLSDVPFLFFSCVILYVTKRIWAQKRLVSWIGISLLTGYAFYLRPIGACFALALLAALLIEKRRKEALACLLTSVFVIGPYMIRNMLVRGEFFALGTEYALIYSQRHGSALKQLVFVMGSNFKFYLHELFVRTIYRWPSHALSPLLVMATIGLGFSLFVLGMKQKGMRGWKKFPVIFLIFYATVLLTWGRQASRYLLPIIPFVLAYFFQGVDSVDRFFRLHGRLVWVFLIASLILIQIPLRRIVRVSLYEQTPLNTPPLHTMAWILDHTGEKDIFAAGCDATLYLYTNRRTLHLPNTPDPLSFDRWIRLNKVGYILQSSNAFVLKTFSKAKQYHPLHEQTLASFANSLHYQIVFDNPKEGMVVYKVLY